MADALPEGEALRRLGANVVLADYPGYGMSEGTPSEAGCYAAADAVYDHVVSRPEVDAARIVPVGWSLGAAVAIDLAARKPVAGVAALSTFTSMRDMARRLVPWAPTALLRHRFESEAKLARLRCPVFLAHGAQDRIIPSAMCDRLAAAAGSRLAGNLRIEEADHNDFFELGGERLFGALGRFLDRVAE